MVKYEGALPVEHLEEHVELAVALIPVRPDTCTVPNCRVVRANLKTDNDNVISIYPYEVTRDMGAVRRGVDMVVCNHLQLYGY